MYLFIMVSLNLVEYKGVQDILLLISPKAKNSA